MNRQRGQGIRLVALVLAVLALVLLVLRVTHVLDSALFAGDVPDGAASPAAGGTPLPTATPAPTPYPTERPTVTFVPEDLGEDSSSPADQWAGQLFGAALPVLSGGSLAGGAFVWWQNPAENGTLAANDDGVWLGGRQLALDDLERLEISIPTAPGSNRLASYGTIAWEGGALMLTAVGGQDGAASTRWLLSNTQPQTAMRALIQQAAEQGYRLTAAYSATFEQHASLVLTAATPAELTPEVTTPPAVDSAAPTRTPTAAPTIQPTPTRAPEALLGETVAQRVNPAAEALADLPDSLKVGFAESHPWVGLLTWTESGPQIAGRAIAIQEAEELTVYVLASSDNGATGERVLSATYNGSFTRLPDDQLIFQGQRMDEILYWMVRAAFDEGGQLLVAYDDFGTRQALTLIDLHTLPPGQ